MWPRPLDLPNDAAPVVRREVARDHRVAAGRLGHSLGQPATARPCAARHSAAIWARSVRRPPARRPPAHAGGDHGTRTDAARHQIRRRGRHPSCMHGHRLSGAGAALATHRACRRGGCSRLRGRGTVAGPAAGAPSRPGVVGPCRGEEEHGFLIAVDVDRQQSQPPVHSCKNNPPWSALAAMTFAARLANREGGLSSAGVCGRRPVSPRHHKSPTRPAHAPPASKPATARQISAAPTRPGRSLRPGRAPTRHGKYHPMGSMHDRLGRSWVSVRRFFHGVRQITQERDESV